MFGLGLDGLNGGCVEDGSLGMLAGVAERTENLGGSAENGLKVLPLTPTGGDLVVTSSKTLLNVELKMGSGVPPKVTSLLGKMFLMVDGDTL